MASNAASLMLMSRAYRFPNRGASSRPLRDSISFKRPSRCAVEQLLQFLHEFARKDLTLYAPGYTSTVWPGSGWNTLILG